MNTTLSDEVQKLDERFKNACSLSNPINREKITECIERWKVLSGRTNLKIRFIEKFDDIFGMHGHLQDDGYSEISEFGIRRNVSRNPWFHGSNSEISKISLGEMMRLRDIDVGRYPSIWEVPFLANASISALFFGDRRVYETWVPMLVAFENGAFMIRVEENEVFIVERPELIKVDEFGDLHSDQGFAFKWFDVEAGFIHGLPCNIRWYSRYNELIQYWYNKGVNARK